MATLCGYELRFLAILAAERAERAESNPPALLPMPAYSSGPDKTGGEGPVVLERTVGDVVLKKAWREAIHSSSSRRISLFLLVNHESRVQFSVIG